MISVLLPARGRPRNLLASLDSLFDLAARPDDVEVIARLDDDDPHLDLEVAYLRAFSTARVDVGPRLGYARMHDYYNGLARQARGEWLVSWNDDMEMVTPEWDRALADAPSLCVQFPRLRSIDATDYTLPVTSRAVYEALGGRLSDNAYCDAWLCDVACHARVAVARDDVVFEHRRLDDATMREQADNGAAIDKLASDAERAARCDDVRRVLAAPGYGRRFDGFSAQEIDRSEHYRRHPGSALDAGTVPAVFVLARRR